MKVKCTHIFIYIVPVCDHLDIYRILVIIRQWSITYVHILNCDNQLQWIYAYSFT
jgi:hypothetical protein